MKLYKYRSLSGTNRANTEAILTGGKLFFATPDKFNDPFEFLAEFVTKADRKEIEKYFEITGFDMMTMLQGLSDEAFEGYVGKLLAEKDALGWPKIVSNLKSKYGILCLSSTFKNINLWSNYADSHQGICFEFESQSEDDYFHHAREVTYVDTPPKIEIIKDFVDEDRRKNIVPKIVYTKYSDSWDHEKEFRILTTKPGAQSFPSSCLTAIYLGCGFNLADPFIKILQKDFPNTEVVLLKKDNKTYSLVEKFRCKARQLI